MSDNLLAARFIARPNRFRVVAALVDSGEIVDAHCADPGRLRELLTPGAKLYVRRVSSPLRKTAFDLRYVAHPQNGQLISLDTRLPNELFEQGLRNRFFPAFADYPVWRREVMLPDSPSDDTSSRIDFLLSNANGNCCWVEVKSVTLVENGVGLFPDAVTARGRRHLLHLARHARGGGRCAVVFIVQRPDANAVMAHRATDPAFAEAMQMAAQNGVEFYACTCQVGLQGVTLERRIEVANLA